MTSAGADCFVAALVACLGCTQTVVGTAKTPAPPPPTTPPQPQTTITTEPPTGLACEDSMPHYAPRLRCPASVVDVEAPPLAAEIRAALRAAAPSLRECYERAQATGASPCVGFTIGLDGRVEDVTLTGRALDALDPALDACLVEALQRLVFTSPRESETRVRLSC